VLVILALAFLAGILTILAPCTLPVVPLVVGSALTGGRLRVVGVMAGFGLAFVATTVLLASALAAAGMTTDLLRLLSGIVLALVGLTLVVGPLGDRLGGRLDGVATVGTRMAGRTADDGLVGGLVVGSAIGLLWAPCVGPIMAGVIALAVSRGPSVETVAIATAYAAGAAIPLAAVAVAGCRLLSALGDAARRARLQRGLGVAMIVVAIAVVGGFDLTFGSTVAAIVPAGPTSPLASGPADARQEAMMTTEPEETALELDDLGPAPELTGITAWINSRPLTMAELRGKVVLVEFWTFGCINCIHVQPYVKAWSDRYAADGLVVVGVHTPELSYERDLDNVRAAVASSDVRFPVAFDPDFATWNAYRNAYWPAFYFVDRAGRIRHTHFGEGDYDGSERVIRQLLADRG
jgi:cytochrome c biogenesis protein CcdA/thiol-disulfide isomerase/thioredoxin